MDLHENARLTFRSRETLAKKIMIDKVDVERGCSRVQRQPKTAAKWVQRYRTLGARIAGSFLAAAP